MANAAATQPSLLRLARRLVPLAVLLTLGGLALPVQGQNGLKAAANGKTENGTNGKTENGTNGNGTTEVDEEELAEMGVPPVCLDDLIRLGLQHQPAVAAARASLASAEAGLQAVNNLRVVGALRHDMPYRRQQAILGVPAAGGGVTAAEWETAHAVARLYLTVIYAKAQDKIVKEMLKDLKNYQDAASKTDPVGALTIQNAMDMVRAKGLQASIGIKRAKAALREALGVEPCFPLPIVGELPPVQQVPCRGDLISMALARRGEIVQVTNAARIVELEVCAQEATGGLNVRTFAASADLHSRPIPAGVNDSEYRPGALGLEMPPFLSGHKEDRVRRARDLCARAAAVVEKTRNLITLEAEDAYLRWVESVKKLTVLEKTVAHNSEIVEKSEMGWLKNLGGTVRDVITSRGEKVQAQAAYNDALYQQALALASLERITAGGFRPCLQAALAVAAAPAAAPEEKKNGN